MGKKLLKLGPAWNWSNFNSCLFRINWFEQRYISWQASPICDYVFSFKIRFGKELNTQFYSIFSLFSAFWLYFYWNSIFCLLQILAEHLLSSCYVETLQTGFIVSEAIIYSSPVCLNIHSINSILSHSFCKSIISILFNLFLDQKCISKYSALPYSNSRLTCYTL